MYAKCINRIRIAVAILMTFSAAGFVICANVAPGDASDFTPAMEPIGMAFVVGVYVSYGATIGLVLEGLIRWSIYKRFQHANNQQSQSPASPDQRRWYQPVTGLVFVVTVIAFAGYGVIGLVVYKVYTQPARLNALRGIHKAGGDTRQDHHWKDEVEGAFVEIDMRGAHVTDREVDYIITLDPKERLLLGKNPISPTCLKRLRDALPNCEIVWTPPTGDERQSRPTADQRR